MSGDNMKAPDAFWDRMRASFEKQGLRMYGPHTILARSWSPDDVGEAFKTPEGWAAHCASVLGALPAAALAECEVVETDAEGNVVTSSAGKPPEETT